MRKFVFCYAYLFFVLLLIPSCVIDDSPDLITAQSDYDYIKIDVQNTENQTKVSSLIKINDVISLETTQSSLISSVNKVVFYNGKIYILNDTGGANENLLLFNEDGRFEKVLGGQGEGPGEYTGLRDFDINRYSNEIFLLSAGKMKIINYDLKGNFINELKTGIFGDQISLFGKSQYLIYNEYNSTERTGANFLSVMENKKGKIEKNFFPYKISLDGFGFRYTGHLERQYDDRILFNLPFRDSIMVVQDGQVAPIIKLDFGGKGLPWDMINNKEALMAGKHIDKAYIRSGFSINKEFALFKYVIERKMSTGLYTIKDKSFYSLRDVEECFLNRLISSSYFIAKNEKEMALVVDPAKIYQYIDQYPELYESLEKEEEFLYKYLKRVKPTDNPIILMASLEEK